MPLKIHGVLKICIIKIGEMYHISWRYINWWRQYEISVQIISFRENIESGRNIYGLDYIDLISKIIINNYEIVILDIPLNK